MNLYRLNKWTIWTTVAITLTACGFQFFDFLLHLQWWWLAYIPLILIPPFLHTVVQWKAWRNAPLRPVAAVLRRPIIRRERESLERLGYTVDNMLVHGKQRAPGPSDALVLLERDLTKCMVGSWTAEQMATSSPDTARALDVLSGTADEVMLELLDRFHERHGDRP